MVGRRRQHAVSKLPCLVLSSAISCRSSICLGRLSTAWLVSLVIFSCHMVSKWWHARSIVRLWGGWYALPRTISFFLVLIISMTFVLSLTQMLVFLSLYVMLSILLPILICAAASSFCACLVSVHVSAPYVIAGSTQELYICLFRQMARLLLKMSRCHGLSVYPVWVCTGQSSHSERASAEWQSSAVTPQFNPSFSFVSRFSKHLIEFIAIYS